MLNPEKFPAYERQKLAGLPDAGISHCSLSLDRTAQLRPPLEGDDPALAALF
jgi:hypothetical protein